jgi:nitrogen fixation protein NifU and related proteins
MATERLSDLYHKDIMQHNAQPYHYEKRLDAPHIIQAYNPLCGDKFKLFLNIDNGIITHATFHGYGCAISKAASSVLIQKIENLPVSDALLLVKNYFLAINTVTPRRDETESIKGLADFEDNMLKPFLAVKQFPERMACATLSWQALDEYLKKEYERETTQS